MVTIELTDDEAAKLRAVLDSAIDQDGCICEEIDGTCLWCETIAASEAIGRGVERAKDRSIYLLKRGSVNFDPDLEVYTSDEAATAAFFRYVDEQIEGEDEVAGLIGRYRRARPDGAKYQLGRLICMDMMLYADVEAHKIRG